MSRTTRTFLLPEARDTLPAGLWLRLAAHTLISSTPRTAPMMILYTLPGVSSGGGKIVIQILEPVSCNKGCPISSTVRAARSVRAARLGWHAGGRHAAMPLWPSPVALKQGGHDMHAYSNPKANKALDKLLVMKTLLRNMAIQLVVLLEMQHF